MQKIRREDDSGAMGVGTLIVFIAMVLVAAVAAGVLVDTANKLQQQAEKAGSEAIREVSSSFTVEEIYGVNYENEVSKTFTWPGSSTSGFYDVKIASEDTSQTVKVAVDKDPNEIFVVKITDYDQVIAGGDYVTLNYQVENVGESSDTQDIQLDVTYP
ncbi:MAG: archaellin/type IV pilin N-terminal domain-containing protein, partial [Thermoplasmatota archaeon]